MRQKWKLELTHEVLTEEWNETFSIKEGPFISILVSSIVLFCIIFEVFDSFRSINRSNLRILKKAKWVCQIDPNSKARSFEIGKASTVGS